ncbi:MAG: response regulator [Chloroflexi bacterium]|nr:response regulator [Chloroflexota bacterium]
MTASVMKGNLFLIHWNQMEAEALARLLRAEGWQVRIEAQDGARAWRSIREDTPDVVVIFLARLPSHGRKTAEALRSTRGTRGLPIVFVDGKPEAVEKATSKVPDAMYTGSAQLKEALAKFARVS